MRSFVIVACLLALPVMAAQPAAPVSDDAAVRRVIDRYVDAREGAGSDARRWTTIVLARTRDGWRISAIRNMSR